MMDPEKLCTKKYRYKIIIISGTFSAERDKEPCKDDITTSTFEAQLLEYDKN